MKRAAPWWWEEKQAWYYKLEGKRHRIGPHPDGAPKPKKNNKGKWNTPREIIDQFHHLMVNGSKQEIEDNESVAAILDDFLSWCYENRAKRTADRYKDFIQDFVKVHGRMSTVACPPRNSTRPT